MTKILTYIMDLIYPTRCGFCEKVIPIGSEFCLCTNCKQDIKFIENGCLKCGKSMAAENSICRDCQNTDHSFDRAYSAAQYTGKLKKAILKLKYYNNRYFIRTLALLLMTKMSNFENIDLIIPIPLHKEKLKLRGFNQSEKISRIAAEIKKLKMDTTSLIRTKNTQSQATLSRKSRIKNMEDAFLVVNDKKIKYKNILLIDDIYTTGSTVSWCAKALKSAGAKKVFVLTIASGKGF